MKLYQFSWGIYPRRIHVYLREKGITDITMVDVDVLNGENRQPPYLGINPLGSIPTLVTDAGHSICQSTNILLYLEQLHPSPDMLGAGDAARSRTLDQLALVNEAYNFAGICTFYGSPLFEVAKRREPSDDVARAMRFEYERVLDSLEQLSGGGDFLGGETPSLADVVFFASEQFMRDLYRLRLPVRCSHLEAVYQRFAQRPSATPAAYPEPMAQLAPVRSF